MDFPSLLAAADRAALGRLGGVAVYTSGLFGDFDVACVFDNADANAIVQGQEVMSSGPRAFLRLSDLPADPETETAGYPRLVVSGMTYSVRDIRKDGQGGVLLSLGEVE